MTRLADFLAATEATVRRYGVEEALRGIAMLRRMEAVDPMDPPMTAEERGVLAQAEAELRRAMPKPREGRT